MTAETALAFLLRINLIAAGTIAVILALRPLALRFLGARSAYRLWLVVPLAMAAALLPPRSLSYVPRSIDDSATIAEASQRMPEDAPVLQLAVGRVVARPLAGESHVAQFVLGAWFTVSIGLLILSLVRTRRMASDAALGPALVGVFRPNLLLPHDFDTRFDAHERELILAHEEVHRASHHTLVNALVELLRCASWFNPLAHVAANRLRADQEIACDAAVIAARPAARRAYAETLLKMRLSSRRLPLGCGWNSTGAKRLGERIDLLARPSPTRRGALAGAAAVAVLGFVSGYAAWSQQEPRVARPDPAWTPVGTQWRGILSHQLEAQRHDRFIELARKGNIDVVFFGTTDTEMFWWPDRGRPIFQRVFGDIHAADFGAQGTLPKTLLWRMQHGELDGYDSKRIVFQLWGIGDVLNAEDEERIAGLAPLLAEMRARQPRARILLSAPFPRGFNSRDEWTRLSQRRAALVAPFVDNRIVFYTDIGNRFYAPDGSHDASLWARWGIKGVGVGAQPRAFDVWAEELQPWLNRFVR
jgi:beta-lactamase regulating signal transducer with metallopeptidase domain